jgi:hypothetical protein
MSRSWMRIVFAPLVIITLVGCSATVADQTEDGIQAAKEAFQEEPAKPNEQVGNVQLFVPGGFSIQEESDETNIILKDNNEAYVLFINPNENLDSQLFYDLLLAEKEDVILAEKTFQQKGRFGFVAILPSGEDQYEIMVSNGGYKLTTISDERNIDDNMEKMMKVVRSVKVKK